MWKIKNLFTLGLMAQAMLVDVKTTRWALKIHFILKGQLIKLKPTQTCLARCFVLTYAGGWKFSKLTTWGSKFFLGSLGCPLWVKVLALHIIAPCTWLSQTSKGRKRKLQPWVQIEMWNYRNLNKMTIN
jgi:hypothetical protein